ncbi:MAG: LppM family (lipo)protein [Ancrocorticia sp.]|uniref:LppM family (lipo)protein n=1 Tax=Ancrocorticia sp. TaxID=2593684 RepID=UPI003F926E92
MISQRKKLVLAVIPAAALLGACQVGTTLSLSEDETISISLEMEDDEGLAAGMTCADFEENFEGGFPYLSDVVIDDLGSDPLSCRFTGTFDQEFYSMAVTTSGDSYTMDIPEEFWTAFNDSSQIEQFGNIDSTFTMEFPGNVSEASNGGQIDGNTVTWEGYDTLSEGVSATGGAPGAPAPATPSAEATTPAGGEQTATAQNPAAEPTDAESDEDSGVDVWVWILLVVAVLALIGVFIYFMRARNKNRGGEGDPRVPGGYVPDGRTAYGAPANPIQGGAPYVNPSQFEQPGQAPQQFGHPQPGGQEPLQYGQDHQTPPNQQDGTGPSQPSSGSPQN